MAYGLDGNEEQLAINLSPGSYLDLFTAMVGPFFGKSENKRYVIRKLISSCSFRNSYTHSTK